MISREEVFTYAAFFVRTLLVTINLKMGATGCDEIAAEDLMHYDWVPTPDFPFSLYSPWMKMFIGWQTYWILLTNQKQNDLHIIKQCGLSDARLTIKFVYTYKLLHVNCHSFRSRMLPLQKLILIDIKLPSESHMHLFFFLDFHVTWRQNKRAA